MSWIDRLSNLIRRDDLNAEIDEELQFHVDARIRDNVAAGMSPEEARREALRRFGGRAAMREATRDADVFVTIEAIAQDIGFAVRSLARRPAFAVVALLTLALGIGANAAIFTIVRSVLLRPLPFPEPERLHIISHAPLGGRFWLYPGLADVDYLAFRDYERSFQATATFGREALTLAGGGGDAVRVLNTTVTPDFLRVLQVSPAAGRSFAAEDAQKGRERVVLVSDALWRSRFGADPGLLHRQITLDGIAHTVVGILPEGFSYPGNTEIWTPLTMELTPNLSLSRPVIGRLKPGITREQAEVELNTFVRTRSQAPEAGYASRVMPLKDAVIGDAGTPLLVFSGAVGFVLLIACANVANLLLMRAISRRHEIATRLALGASRGRLIRLLMTEAALLALCGGLLGLYLAELAQPALLSLIPPGKLPRRAEIHADVWVWAFTFGISALTACLVGLVPALQAQREDLSAVARETSSSSTRRSHRIRHALVVAEIALALVLLVGAGLLARSFLQVRSVDPGFEPGRVMTMTLDVPRSTYPTAPALQGFHDRVLGALSTLDGVEAAAAINWLPLGDMLLRGGVMLDGGRTPPGDYTATKAAVSPRYFAAMGIPLRGRDFADDDRAGAPGVVIVSEAVARRLWPNEEAIGQRLSVESRPKPEDWLTVVGVAGDVRQGGVMEPIVPAVYQPYRQVRRPGFLSRMAFVVRTADNQAEPALVARGAGVAGVAGVAGMMRGALRSVDADQAPQSMSSMDAVLADAIAEPWFQTRLVGLFSALALVLAAVGIYGVLAASVMERQREIGIRMALGADRRAVVAMVIRRTLIMTASGVLLGVAGAAAVTKALRTLLFEIQPTDTVAFAAAAGLLAIVALLAGLLPARKASAVDPVVALRAP